MTEHIRKQAALLQTTLKAFGVNVVEVDPAKAQIGPSVIRYRVRLGIGARLSSLQSHAEDIGRELASNTMPIIDNIPGEVYVGVDIERPDRQTVSFEEGLAKLEQKGPLSLPIAIGVNPAGEHLSLDLVTLPHLLCAGSTGSGKTVFLQALVASIAHRATPQADIIIIDPKATDFTVWADSNLLGDGRVITEPVEAVAELRRLVEEELPRRTALLREVQAANLGDYIGLGLTDLRPIVVVVDEFADLMMVLGKAEREQLEGDITRLAQRARSVGIHLVLATQRPTVDIITGKIKANLPVRVAFHLPQAVDSRTIIDCNGAEGLFGRGDMLLSLGDKLSRYQGYFLDTSTIRSWTKQKSRRPAFLRLVKETTPPVVVSVPVPVVHEDSEATEVLPSAERGRLVRTQVRTGVVPLINDMHEHTEENLTQPSEEVSTNLRIAADETYEILAQVLGAVAAFFSFFFFLWKAIFGSESKSSIDHSATKKKEDKVQARRTRRRSQPNIRTK